MARAEKKDVRYSDGMPKSNCGLCLHFREAVLGIGGCTEVKGIIDASKWCTRFKKGVEK